MIVKKIKAFTLIEVLLSVMIIGILITILFRSYKTMVDISLRVENEKSIQQEMLYLTQAMQSLADRYTVDYDRYTDPQMLIDNQGLVDELFLIDESGRQATINTQGACFFDEIESVAHRTNIRNREDPCQLVIQIDGSEPAAIPSPQLVRLSHVGFKITPYVSNQQILYSGVVSDTDQAYALLQYPGFWLFGRMYHKLYGGGRSTNAKSVIHQYYNTTDVLTL